MRSVPLPNLLLVQLVGRRASAMLLMRTVLQVRRGPTPLTVSASSPKTAHDLEHGNSPSMCLCACPPCALCPKERCYMMLQFPGGQWLLEAHQNPRRPCSRCSVANPTGAAFRSAVYANHCHVIKLRGCVRCNWWRRDGKWQQQAEEDIAALRGPIWQRPS